MFKPTFAFTLLTSKNTKGVNQEMLDILNERLEGMLIYELVRYYEKNSDFEDLQNSCRNEIDKNVPSKMIKNCDFVKRKNFLRVFSSKLLFNDFYRNEKLEKLIILKLIKFYKENAISGFKALNESCSDKIFYDFSCFGN